MSTPAVQKCAPKTPKGEQRSRALLLSAIDIFVEKGYSGTSLAEIISRAGGSRSKIYEWYGGKEGLFIAALELMIDEVYQEYLKQYQEGRSYREELQIFGRIFLKGMLKKRALGCARLVFSESVRLPKIGEWFYKQGAELSYNCFAKVLENSIPLDWDELKQISNWYVESLKSRTYFLCLCDPKYEPTEEDIERDVAFSAEVIQAYIKQRLEKHNKQSS